MQCEVGKKGARVEGKEGVGIKDRVEGNSSFVAREVPKG